MNVKYLGGIWKSLKGQNSKKYRGKLFGGTVLPNNALFGGTVPPNNMLFGGTPDSERWYLIQWKVLDTMNAGMQVRRYACK